MHTIADGAAQKHLLYADPAGNEAIRLCCRPDRRAPSVLDCSSSALYQHWVEEAWSRALSDGKDPNRRIMKYDMEELQKGFDFAAWLPARCADKYRRKRSAD